MKRILFIFLLFPSLCFGWGTIPLQDTIAEVVAAGGECDFVTGDYDFGYNGDQASGDTYGCDAGSPVNGTESEPGIVTTNGQSGNGVEVDANDKYLKFTKTQVWHDHDATLWVKFSATTGDNAIFEAYGDVNDFFYLRADSSNHIRIHYSRDGANKIITTSNSTILDNTWFKIEWEVDADAGLPGGKELGIRIDYNGDGDFDDVNEGWEYEAGGDGISPMGETPDDFVLGEDQIDSGVNNTVFTDNLLIDWH